MTTDWKDDDEMKVYVKPGCPWCVDVLAYLRKNGYNFQERNVIANPEYYEEMRRISGQTSAPTMTVAGLMLADFGVEELVPFLADNDLLPG